MGKAILALYAVTMGAVAASVWGPPDAQSAAMLIGLAAWVPFMILLVAWLAKRAGGGKSTAAPVIAFPIAYLWYRVKAAIDWTLFLDRERRKERIRAFIAAAKRFHG